MSSLTRFSFGNFNRINTSSFSQRSSITSDWHGNHFVCLYMRRFFICIVYKLICNKTNLNKKWMSMFTPCLAPYTDLDCSYLRCYWPHNNIHNDATKKNTTHASWNYIMNANLIHIPYSCLAVWHIRVRMSLQFRRWPACADRFVSGTLWNTDSRPRSSIVFVIHWTLDTCWRCIRSIGLRGWVLWNFGRKVIIIISEPNLEICNNWNWYE